MTKQNILVALLGVVLLLFILGISPFFVVDVTETVLVVQLGKPIRNVTEPGLSFKIPFIQEVERFDKRLLDYDSSPQEVITQDKKTILIDNFAKWRIVDPLKVFQAFGSQRGALQRLHDIIYSELRVELGRHELSEIVSKTRAELMHAVTERSNEKAVFARMQAERERQAKQYRAEGAEQAQKIRSEAEKDREILLAEAYKTSEELRGAGDAKAFKIYAQAYGQNPKFFDFIRSMEAYKKSFKDNSTIVMGPDSEFFRFLKQR